MSPIASIIVSALAEPEVRDALRVALGSKPGDELVSVEAGATELGISVRQLRDDLRRRGVPLEKVGATSFVRRSALTRAAAPKASPTTSLSPREAARAAVAARAAAGGR